MNMTQLEKLRAAEAKLARVEAIHYRVPAEHVKVHGDGWCHACPSTWPCPTIAALADAPAEQRVGAAVMARWRSQTGDHVVTVTERESMRGQARAAYAAMVEHLGLVEETVDGCHWDDPTSSVTVKRGIAR
jgi:Tfp pilus assembly protein FimT